MKPDGEEEAGTIKVCSIFCQTPGFQLVAFAAVFWDVTQRSPKKTGINISIWATAHLPLP